MAQQTSGRRVRRFSAGVLTAALLVACGGGELFALLQIVTPLGGSWSDDNTESLFFSSPPEADQMFASTLTVTATVTSSKGVCGATAGNPVADVPGTLDNGKLTLRLNSVAAPCLEGNFTDLRRLESNAPVAPTPIVYLNDRVAVNLPVGLWSTASGTPTLKFTTTFSVDNGQTTTVAGCDMTNSAAKVPFTGTLHGFNTTTLAVPIIPALDGTAFTQVQFVDGATLKMLNGGQSVTLTRKVDPTPVTVPPTPPC